MKIKKDFVLKFQIKTVSKIKIFEIHFLNNKVSNYGYNGEFWERQQLLSYWRNFLHFTAPEHILQESYVYWTVHHLDSWIRRDKLDVSCFIISLFTAQHVSDVNTSILRSLRLICWGYFMGCIALVRNVLVLRCGMAGVVWYPDVLTSETCW